MGEWNGGVCSNGAFVPAGTICEVTPKYNYECTSAGTCGIDGNFASAAACTGDCDANEHVKDTVTFTVVDHESLEDPVTPNTMKAWHGIASSADGMKLAAVVGEGSIWTSTTSGATWVERENTCIGTCNWGGIVSSADGNKLAAVVWGGNIWTSSNSGAGWVEQTNPGVYHYAITMSADGAKLAATTLTYQGQPHNIFTSSNSGASWTGVTAGTAGVDLRAITSSADGTHLAAGAYNGNIWTSSNSGATWTQRVVGDGTNNWDGITSSADGTKLAVVVNGGNIWTSSNSGATWTEVTSTGATKSWRGITSSADGTHLAASVQNGNIWTSINSGYSWTERIIGTGTNEWEGYPSIASSADGDKLVAVVDGGDIWSGFSGLHCIACPTGYLRYAGDLLANGETVCTPTCDENEHVKNTVLVPSDDTSLPSVNLGWATMPVFWGAITSSADGTKLAATPGEFGSNIWTSSNSGANWAEITVGDGTKSFNCITSSEDGTKLAAGAEGGNIWISDNSGATWTERVVGDGTNSWKTITSSGYGTHLAAGAEGGNIWTSSNSGATWTERVVGDGTNNWKEGSITMSDDGMKLAAAVYEGNIWTSDNSGATWTERVVGDGTNYWYGITSSDDGMKLAAVAPDLDALYDDKIHGTVWTSSNSGANWEKRVVGVSSTDRWYDHMHSIASSADGTKLAAVVGGTIWTSANIGATWLEVTVDIETGHHDIAHFFTAITSSADGTTVSVAEEHGKIWSGLAGLQCIACPTSYVRAAGDWVDDGETACSFSL